MVPFSRSSADKGTDKRKFNSFGVSCDVDEEWAVSLGLPVGGQEDPLRMFLSHAFRTKNWVSVALETAVFAPDIWGEWCFLRRWFEKLTFVLSPDEPWIEIPVNHATLCDGLEEHSILPSEIAMSNYSPLGSGEQQFSRDYKGVKLIIRITYEPMVELGPLLEMAGILDTVASMLSLRDVSHLASTSRTLHSKLSSHTSLRVHRSLSP
jgi:hypothetical protein